MGNLGRYLLANRQRAIPITVLCALSAFFLLPGLFIACLIIILFTLQLGYREGAKLLVCTLLPFIALMWWQQLAVLYILFFVLRYCLTWVVAGIYGRYVSWRLVLELLTVIGLLVVVVAHLGVSDIALWWKAFINKYMVNQVNLFADNDSTKRMADQFYQYTSIATGLVCVFVFTDCCVQLLLARYWQMRVNNVVDGLYNELIVLRMGPVFAIILAIVMIGKLWGSALAVDCLPVVLFPFVLAGLSVLHYVSYQYRKFKWALILIYVGLVLGSFLMIWVLAAIAYVDSLVNLRKYYRATRA